MADMIEISDIIGLTGVIIGSVIAIVSQIVFDKIKDNKEEKFNNFILYTDLVSIEDYICNFNKRKAEHSNTIDEGKYPDIRFNKNWLDVVANCCLKKTEQIKLVKNIYDTVYDFNYEFNIRYESIINNSKSTAQFYDAEFKQLKGLIESDGYKELIDSLEKNIKLKKN